MRILFNGEVSVDYGQLYVESDPDRFDVDLHEAFAGQQAGLCGAATPGFLFLTTGLRYGDVGFTVEVHEEPPLLDPSWEETVEVSFRPLSPRTELLTWSGEVECDLGLQENDYRVRYCATGMKEAAKADEREDGEPPLDRYLLQFWPAPPQPARVVKQTTEEAARRHRMGQGPSGEQEEAERLAREEAEWGGRPPSEALRRIGKGTCDHVLRFDPALVHAIDVAGAECQRAVAGLAARSACTVAGIAELDWVAPALKDLEQARPLSAPFDDDEKAWELVRTDRRVPWRTAREAVPPSQRPSSDPTVIFQPHLALGVVFAAAQDDPLRAALRAVSSGISTFGEGYRDLLDEVWAALPERDRSQPQPGASG